MVAKYLMGVPCQQLVNPKEAPRSILTGKDTDSAKLVNSGHSRISSLATVIYNDTSLVPPIPSREVQRIPGSPRSRLTFAMPAVEEEARDDEEDGEGDDEEVEAGEDEDG